jgi:adenylylsulfate kinase-like enzyme
MINMAKNNLKERLQALNDSELKTLILTIASASGIKSETANLLVSDMPSLRRKLYSLDNNDITSILSSFGTADAEKALKSLGK